MIYGTGINLNLQSLFFSTVEQMFALASSVIKRYHRKFYLLFLFLSFVVTKYIKGNGNGKRNIFVSRIEDYKIVGNNVELVGTFKVSLVYLFLNGIFYLFFFYPLNLTMYNN